MRRNHSGKRDAIYEAFVSADNHPSARDIYDKLKPDYPGLSLGTVYRNIGVVKDEGKINSVCTINGEERFDGNVSPHAHFVCVACGKIEDIPMGQLSAEYMYLENEGFSVEKASLTFYGKCRNCK